MCVGGERGGVNQEKGCVCFMVFFFFILGKDS